VSGAISQSSCDNENMTRPRLLVQSVVFELAVKLLAKLQTLNEEKLLMSDIWETFSNSILPLSPNPKTEIFQSITITLS